MSDVSIRSDLEVGIKREEFVSHFGHERTEPRHVVHESFHDVVRPHDDREMKVVFSNLKLTMHRAYLVFVPEPLMLGK